jgi:hypothetical protein
MAAVLNRKHFDYDPNRPTGNNELNRCGERNEIMNKRNNLAARAHSANRRVDQYRSVAGLARALVWTLAVSCVALSVEPAWAVSPPRVIVSEQSTKISDKCTDFRNLATVTQTIMNSGDPLAANQDKIYVYVGESTEFKGGGSHLHSRPVFIPAMAHGAKIWLKIPVGTVKYYRGKLPGLHMLYVHLVANGKDSLADVLLIEFPKGYCQPIIAKQPVTPPRIFSRKDMVKGMVLSRSSRLPSLAKPKLTIRFALASPANNCDPNRLLKVNVVIRNSGGPLPAHTRFAYVHAVEPGGAHLTGPNVSLPAISSRETWQGVLTVGTRKSFFPKLPGRHTLVVSIGPDHAAPGTLAYIPSPPFRATVSFPAGYCQQSRYRSIGALMRRATHGAIHETIRGKPTVSLRHGMQQRGVQKKLAPVTPALRFAPRAPVHRLAPTAPVRQTKLPTQLRLRKKLAPADPVRSNLPMQLRLNR